MGLDLQCRGQRILQSFAKGDIDPSATVDIVDKYTSAVYANPYACDVNGLATLGGCGKSETGMAKSLLPDGGIGKAVTLAGAFVPQTWATEGRILSMEEVKGFYGSNDFREMADLGVNTIQIPVPCDTFYESGDVERTVSKLLERIDGAGLSAILVLVRSFRAPRTHPDH